MNDLIKSLQEKSKQSHQKYLDEKYNEANRVLTLIQSFEDTENKQEYRYDANLSKVAINRLEEWGFKVSDISAYNDVSFIISWKENK